ncbi:hypothetical protein AS156_05150 [Bradyrhizobium macuxiense]|uniref:Uncharacterized protein n=1 Tax=Bradyrhizobium macuxiense TaxID=1755647 RepID=A0A120FNW3_9BRAD|nr:hypothetical protein AS156_05150 [Bradyrhizobium macuxiense]
MKTARTARNTISRANPGVFPLKNPFEKMGLTSGDSTRETPSAEPCLTSRADHVKGWSDPRHFILRRARSHLTEWRTWHAEQEARFEREKR